MADAGPRNADDAVRGMVADVHEAVGLKHSAGSHNERLKEHTVKLRIGDCGMDKRLGWEKMVVREELAGYKQRQRMGPVNQGAVEGVAVGTLMGVNW